MPVTLEHEYLIELIRNRPSLVTTLLNEVGVTVPSFDEARLSAADFTYCRPTEYRADSVVVLFRDNEPVRAVVLEVQRKYDEDKVWSWPVYMATLRAIQKCPVVLLVFCEDDKTAMDCKKPIHMGHPGWVLSPVVAATGDVPRVTDVQQALADPELAALSAIVHGDPTTAEGRRILSTFFQAGALRKEGLPGYSELVIMLQPTLDVTKFFKEYGMALPTVEDVLFHPFVRECVEFGEAKGQAKGEAKGEATAIVLFLEARGVQVTDEARTRIVECTDTDVLESWVRKAVTADSVEELFA
ncbi:hypothetical protein AB0I81_27835 [Nonomuraea sp. NPDC050404]|uniref:hypothetical protein n=1 Tax=Nonomuraea sp. NPDC050404 TaxID=3155783 RepID=UPI0033D7FB54